MNTRGLIQAMRVPVGEEYSRGMTEVFEQPANSVSEVNSQHLILHSCGATRILAHTRPSEMSLTASLIPFYTAWTRSMMQRDGKPPRAVGFMRLSGFF
jgi:hypothetical protein